VCPQAAGRELLARLGPTAGRAPDEPAPLALFDRLDPRTIVLAGKADDAPAILIERFSGKLQHVRPRRDQLAETVTAMVRLAFPAHPGVGNGCCGQTAVRYALAMTGGSGHKGKGPGRRGTSYDVARIAGVSQSAVSRAFRPGASVAPDTRERIYAAAKTVGYRPNALAEALITRRSNMVAVVISNLTNLYYPEVLAELTLCLSGRGMRVLLFALKAESDIDHVLDQIWRYQVDGAIVAARLSAAQLGAFAEQGVPIILYNRTSEQATVSSVCCEFAAGERELVDRLVAGGARRFAIIGGPEDSAVGEARVAGALARLASAGFGDVPVARGDFSYESGRRAALALLAGERFDALIAANDVMALGAMDAARLELGLAVPADLSVVGFDGVAPALWRSYQLTTVRQPVRRMTAAAVEMLAERIADPSIGVERRVFSGDLIEGTTIRR